ncbi:NADPH-dependent FMN reductase [Pseudomonas sp. 5Ae-yellow]|uniref:NADPH-dependent FMN reductase n=1 Tax=Pseudomonas sp. 5Ae-yellow TaxID=2759848 RepID=UPI000C94558D|nr:NAD(P)H-dependent oxidoreductase [Pseudomonas sp. 5Ae-yellow]MAB85918.1 NADPH-dependent FMN reductase [Paracoccaceae bacterium]MBA6421279.1 NAD(P)H-dependent oxidoreductase [Pseudomonas sp. 5Ae-yellow]
MTNICIVAGSGRPESQTSKVAQFIHDALIEHHQVGTAQVSIIDLGTQPLPMWPSEDAQAWPEIAAKLSAADGIVVLAPEWHGMACPAIKNFFLYASKAELAHKPAMLGGISASVGGAFPVSELRASSYKNCRLCYIPEHLIVRNVGKVLNGTEVESDADQRLRERLNYNLDILLRYAQALAPVRTAIDMSNPAFANGMS